MDASIMHPASRTARAAFLCAVILFAPAGSLHAQSTPVPEAGVSADEWAARGRAADQAGEPEEALASFDHALAVDPARLDLRLEYAELLKKSGFWIRSAEQYRRVLAARPQDTPAMIGYGELLNAQYQFSAAAEHFSRALQAGVESHDRERVLVGLGSARFGMEDYLGAARVFEGILKESPRVMTAMAYLAIAKRRLGHLDEAEKIWNRFLEIDPVASPARISLIEVQELSSRIETARGGVQAEPRNADLWAELGSLLRHQPDLLEAEKAYAAAAHLAQGKASHHFAHGTVLRDLGRWPEAMEAFGKAAGDGRLGVLSLYNLAHAARRAGDSRRETRAWADAVHKNSGDLYAYRRYLSSLRAHGGLDLELARARTASQEEGGAARQALALARLSMAEQASGNLEASQRAAIDAVRAGPIDVHAQRVVRDHLMLDQEALRRALTPGNDSKAAGAGALLRGAILLALSKDSQAEPELRKALEAAPSNVAAMTALASCLRARGKLAEAIQLLDKARRQASSDLYAHLDASLALSDAGRPEEAASAAREAVRLAPGNPLGHALLGTALRQAGHLEEAALALEEAMAIDPMDDLGAPRLLLAKIKGQLGLSDEGRDVLKGDLPQEPEEIYNLAWEFVRDRYHDRNFHGQDWNVWRRRFEGKLKTTPDALGAIALMLSSLDDRDTSLRSADQTARRLFTQRTTTQEFGSTGAASVTSRSVESKRLEENVGYIAITNLDDPRSPAKIREAVEEMKTADAVILDLRGNMGGSDSDVPGITSLFVPPGTQTGTTITPEGKERETVPRTGAGAPLIPEGKRVVVLVDRNTASSAETLAGSLKESGRAVVVGEQTHGKGGIQAPRLLPGGAVVLVVTAQHGDKSGQAYGGRGIQPDVSVQALPGQRGPDDPALKKARDVLKKGRKDD